MMADVPKGPWWLDARYDGLSVSWTGSRAICGAHEDTGNTDPPAFIAHTTRGWRDGGIGNARLLAAAPELYQAVDSAPIMSKYHGHRGFEAERFIADYEEWRERCRAALAKARGE